MSKGPTAGKEKPGITFSWREIWEELRAHKPYQRDFRELLSRLFAILIWYSITYIIRLM